MTTPSGADVGAALESSSVLPRVDSDDIVQACVKHLAAFADLTSLLASFEDGEPFLFQHELQGVVESTQRAAVVVSLIGSWAAPNVHNSMRFPRLLIEVYVDPIRDEDNNTTEPIEAFRRTNYIFDVINSHLHRPGGGDEMWGTVRTIDCSRLGEPVSYVLPQGDGGRRGMLHYAVTTG